ncbi:sulfatase-like hydrolase/transferase [Actinomycetes bacterium KLBMP 9797]
MAKRELYAFLEIAALCGLALAQPLLDVTGKSPDFFLFHGAGARDVLLLVLLVIAAPPVALWGIGALAGVAGRLVARVTPPVALWGIGTVVERAGLAGRRPRAVAHAATVGGLFAVLAVQVGKHLLPVRGLPLALLALLAAAGLTAAYLRWKVPAQILRVASVGPVVFALLFVFASPASAVVLARESGGAGPGGRKADRHPPVVVLLFDEFPVVSLLGPDGRIDAAKYPNIAALAGGATWYRNATAASGWSPYAVPAMLSGKWPAKDGAAPHFSQHPDNLFTLMSAEYDLRVRESITQLCPPRLCPDTPRPKGGLPTLVKESATLLEQIVLPVDSQENLEESYQEVTAEEAEQPPPSDPRFRFGALADNQPARFTQFLDDLSPTAGKPRLSFLHLLMPHTPWNYLASGMRYDAPGDLKYETPGWERLGYERHLQQVRYTDTLVGQVLDRMRDSGLYDDALLVVTADHGVSFTAGAAGRGLDQAQKGAAEILWAPLFVKEPGQTRGRVDDRNWQHIDLLPTIADLAGVTVPWSTDGVSAVSQARTGGGKEYHDTPGKPLPIDGAKHFAAVQRGTSARPELPAPPAPELVGRPVSTLTVTGGGAAAADAAGTGGGGATASVVNRDAFAAVDPASGTLPALVTGTVAKSVSDGTALAVAVNGRIGAVVRVNPPDEAGRRFGALLTDETLFRAGANELALYEIVSGTELRQLQI